jgi:hypothetical protein
LHDLPSLQKPCGSRSGWPASKTLDVAQELYDGQGKKIIDCYVSYWSEGPVGHTFVSFIFDNAPPLCISIETRPEVGEGFNPIASLFKQFELTYVRRAAGGRQADAITLADICLASQAAGAKFFSVDAAPFSNFTRIANSLSTIDAFAPRAPAEAAGCPAS